MSGEVALGRTEVQHGPHGAHSPDAGPFNPRQLGRIDEAITLSSRESGLTFSVYVGELKGANQRDAAEELYRQVGDASSVLVAVSPGQRSLHIVTGGAAADRLTNRSCGLAAMAMRSSFANGDIAGGVVAGLRMLADAAGKA